jgi:hypothetical protein
VGSDDVLDPSELDDDVTLVIVNALAMPGFPPPMPGCELRPCLFCKRDTWAAPSSIAAEHVRKTVHVCRRDAIGASLVLGGFDDVHRLPGAAADVTAPGSLVTPEGETADMDGFRAETRRHP